MSRPRKYYKRKESGSIKARTTNRANDRQGEAIRGMNSVAAKDILRKIPEAYRSRAEELLRQYISNCKSEGRTPRTNGALAMLNNQLTNSDSLYAKNRTLILNLGMSVEEFNDEIGLDIDLSNTVLVEGKNVITLKDGSVVVFYLQFNYDGGTAISGVERYKDVNNYLSSLQVV